MTVSKDQHVANTNGAADGELAANQLDQVSGGDPVVVTVTTNKQTASQKAAAAADALIRG